MTIATIKYRKNMAYSENQGEEKLRLFAEVDLSGFGIKNIVRALPVYYRKLIKPVGPVRVVYTSYIAGLPLEAGNLTRLEWLIDDTLRKIIRFEHLPEYFFQVKDNAWPIYHPGSELISRYPGGPVFSTGDIASLRVWLADHFKAIGRIQNRRKMNLLYLSPYDLQIYAPFCVLRTLDETIPDIPIFPMADADGVKLIAPIGRQTLSANYAGGKGIFSLYRQVSDIMLFKGQIKEPYEISIRKLSPTDWSKLESQLKPELRTVVYERELNGSLNKVIDPLYATQDLYVVARTNRIGNKVLYIDRDVQSVTQRVGLDLHYYGTIRDPHDIQSLPLMAF
ncbi:MAG: hypothetical protein CVU39_24125 [Chloroflexi bacterium HGW-Chloroflexi-10]|nr:MAG: hypothetical protein CVU39_24125 [Chloroflexi bacterium HGW-Chloroflexi-10]